MTAPCFFPWCSNDALDGGDFCAQHRTHKIGDFDLMPPPRDACPVCARRPPHPPSQPHDGSSLFFMYWWRAHHGRWGTWKDAIEHCTPEMREAWEAELKRRGVWTEPSE